MIRVGILAIADKNCGGTLGYTKSVIEALRDSCAGFMSVTIYTMDTNGDYNDCCLPIHRVSCSVFSLGRMVLFRDLFSAEDIVISPVYSIFLLATRKRFIFTLHDLQEHYYPENFSIYVRLGRFVAYSILTKFAAAIMCESRFVRDDINRIYNVPLSSIHVIPAPPISKIGDVKLDSESVSLCRKRYGIHSKYILYPAQFWPHKNHARLIKAFKIVLETNPDCCLVLTGKERYEYNSVMKLASEIGVCKKIVHIGYVDVDDLICLYQGAALVVIPTLFESISIPIYEAFAIGAPVCASAIGALPEQVGDAGLLFDPMLVGDMAEKMITLLGNSDLCCELRKRGKNRINSVTNKTLAAGIKRLVHQTVT